MRRPRLLLLLPVLFITIACGGDPPEKEIEQARNAVNTARAAGADHYAPEEFAAAASALENASSAVEQRDYRLALNHALDSKERAENATREAADAMATERTSTEALVKTVATALDSTHAKVKAAEAAHVAARTLTPIRSQVAAAETKLQEARTALDQKNFAAAKAAADESGSALKAVNEALDAAAGPAARRRR